MQQRLAEPRVEGTGTVALVLPPGEARARVPYADEVAAVIRPHPRVMPPANHRAHPNDHANPAIHPGSTETCGSASVQRPMRWKNYAPNSLQLSSRRNSASRPTSLSKIGRA